MDADYLKRTVGPALTNALTAMVTDQPKDSVEYLGQYLLRFVEREEGKAATAELFAQSAAQAAAKEEALAAEAAESKAAESEAAELLPGQSSVDLALADPATDVPTMYEPVLELVKLATGATHAYLGVKGTAEPESEGDPAKPVISWLAGTSGSSMAGEALVGANPDDEESKAEGVTFDLFVGAEPPEPAEGDEPLPEGADPLIYPSEVVVPNVVRHPNMKFFGVPKMGAYVAVPVKYKSCLHADGIGEAEASEEGGEGGGKTPSYQPVEMMLGFHTMGQAGRQFTDGQVAAAKEWAQKLATSLEQSELTTWGAEVVKVEAAAEAAPAVGEAVAETSAAAEAARDEAAAALEANESLSPETKDLEIKKLAYAAAKEVLASLGQQLEALGSRKLPPKPEPSRALHALLYTLLYEKNLFVDASTRKVNWEKMRQLFGPPLVAKLAAYDPASEKNVYPRYARVEDMRRLLEVDAEALAAEGPLFAAALDLATKAVDVREAAVVAREAADAAAAELAAQEAELNGLNDPEE